MNNRLVEIATNPDPERSRTVEGIVAGFLLLLVAIAAVAMAWTRLQADFDRATFEETLTAIDENLLWYSWHGTARIFFGGLLIPAASMFGLAMTHAQGWQLKISMTILMLGGVSMAVSGVLVIFIASVYWADVFNIEQFDGYRALAGNIANTLIGLAIILITPTQWHLGGFMKLPAISAPLTGIGMIIVWWDSSTIHQISGALFLLWIVGTSLALIFAWFGQKEPDDSALTSGQAQKFQA